MCMSFPCGARLDHRHGTPFSLHRCSVGCVGYLAPRIRLIQGNERMCVCLVEGLARHRSFYGLPTTHIGTHVKDPTWQWTGHVSGTSGNVLVPYLSKCRKRRPDIGALAVRGGAPSSRCGSRHMHDYTSLRHEFGQRAQCWRRRASHRSCKFDRRVCLPSADVNQGELCLADIPYPHDTIRTRHRDENVYPTDLSRTDVGAPVPRSRRRSAVVHPSAECARKSARDIRWLLLVSPGT
ncbi:hypothetical protein C8Q76DRAFT_160458 [Earliella scabrosa]|nr:hypothetical protein C8Q76DRAFT_160458 [Earliella scabrosa]